MPGVGASACLSTSVVPRGTSQAPGGLAVSLLTTKGAYNKAISLVSLAISQKLGEDVDSGAHQGITSHMNLKSLESTIFLPSHLHAQHLKVTQSVNLISKSKAQIFVSGHNITVSQPYSHQDRKPWDFSAV